MGTKITIAIIKEKGGTRGRVGSVGKWAGARRNSLDGETEESMIGQEGWSP